MHCDLQLRRRPCHWYVATGWGLQMGCRLTRTRVQRGTRCVPAAAPAARPPGRQVAVAPALAHRAAAPRSLSASSAPASLCSWPAGLDKLLVGQGFGKRRVCGGADNAAPRMGQERRRRPCSEAEVAKGTTALWCYLLLCCWPPSLPAKSSAELQQRCCCSLQQPPSTSSPRWMTGSTVEARVGQSPPSRMHAAAPRRPWARYW